MTSYELIIFIKLLLSHILADFFFQPSKWVKLKTEKKLKSGYLYIHCLIAAITAYLLLNQWGDWYIIIAVFIAHLIIDVIKIYLIQNVWTFIFDQFLHFISLYLISLYITNNFSLEPFFVSLNSDRNLIISFCYLIVTLPVGTFISKVLNVFDKEISLDSLHNSGLLIGVIERILVLSLVLLNQYEAIGFLMASKSFWFSSKSEFGKKERDYILIGNLMSYTIAIIVGIMCMLILKQFNLK